MNSNYESKTADVRQKRGNRSGEKRKQSICPICEKVMTSTYLKQHLMIHSGEKPFICPICSKQFRHKFHLTTHVRVHSGDKPFSCPKCHKQFAQKGHLKGHYITHSDEKQFLTRTTQELFTQDNFLADEKQLVGPSSQETSITPSNLRPHMCNFCLKVFYQKSDLVRHIRIHSGEKPFICDNCTKGFTQRNNLIHHLRIHSGVKPYICDVCMKGFAHKYGLIYHLGIHSGAKPFRCSTCKKAFTQKNVLTKHLKIHQREKLLIKKFTKPLRKNSKLVFQETTDDEIKQCSSNGYLENVKKEKYDGLEENRSELSFEVPLIKKEFNVKDELSDEPIASSSYQYVIVKEELAENADPTKTQIDD